MTLDEIAGSITPTGYAAAIIGLILCLLVVILRFRARNLVEEQAYQAAMLEEKETGKPEDQAMAPTVDPEKPKTPFKAYVPEESATE